MNKKIIFKSILVILWLIVIYFFSSQSGSQSTNLTKGLIEKIFWFIENDFFFVFIRKCAHFTEYLILGLLIYNLLSEFNVSYKSIIIFLSCLICASLDEIHQMFVFGRSGNIIDVLIDISGTITFLLILIFIKLKKTS